MSFIKDDLTPAVTEMRSGFVQKRCSKCGGNIYLDKDLYGWYEECLQCGFAYDLGGIVDAREVARQEVSVS